MKLITFFLSFIVLSSVSLAEANQDECSQRYRSKIFSKVGFDGNVDFEAWTKNNTGQILRYDVYYPKDDTAALRPLVILWHGGAYVDLLDKTSPDITSIAKDLAKMGYVVISPDYRGIRNLLDFLDEEKLVKHVIRATLDANDAVCHIINQIDHGGNPYRINKNEIFAGGVSAGAVSGLHGIFINDLDDLGPKYAQWARQVDKGRADEALANRFCSPDVIKGFISISGAMLDTSFIKYHPIKSLLIHGTEDDVLYFDVGQPLGGFTAAPDLYGSKPIQEKLDQIGVDSKLLVFEGRGHVPFMNLDIFDIISLNLIDEKIYDYTMEQIVDFLFNQITCEKASEAPTGIFNRNITELNFHPNPVEESFRINMPGYGEWQVQVFDITGKLVKQQTFYGQNFDQSVTELSKGVFIVHISNLQNSDGLFTGKIIRQ